MRIPVFLSYPKPYLQRQEKFINQIKDELCRRGLEPMTLGVTDYDMLAPLKGIRRLMLSSNGLITIAFRRAYIEKGCSRPESDITLSKGSKTTSSDISDTWLTSPFCQIEPAMAFQMGLPILILRENGVIAEGILERDVLGQYLPEFNLDENMDDFFSSEEWRQILSQWCNYVEQVYRRKGNPAYLYKE